MQLKTALKQPENKADTNSGTRQWIVVIIRAYMDRGSQFLEERNNKVANINRPWSHMGKRNTVIHGYILILL